MRDRPDEIEITAEVAEAGVEALMKARACGLSDDGVVRAVLCAALQAAKGMALVPIEPTAAMLDEGWYEANVENAAGVWRDMMAAALSTKERELL